MSRPRRQRPRGPLRITALDAYLSINADGDEGLGGTRTAGGDWIPLIGADRARIASLRETARQIARQSGTRVQPVRFTGREAIEAIDP